MIYLTNPGILDLRAITMLGVNAKPNSFSPIGYFGTGLKYAIAALMRMGGQLTIHTGDGQVVNFGTKTSNFRGEVLHTITYAVDGFKQTLPYTTSLGRNWEPWMVAREFYCNMLDEGGNLSYEPASGAQVSIEIEHKDVEYFLTSGLSEWFFASDNLTPDASSTKINIYRRKTSSLFYRGIKVYTLPNEGNFAFTYNKLSETKLTEDRTLAAVYDYNFYINLWLRHSLLSAETKADFALLVEALAEGTYERQVLLEHPLPSAHTANINSQLFQNIAAINSHLSVPPIATWKAWERVVRLIEARKKETPAFDGDEETMLARAREYFTRADIPVFRKYEVVKVHTDDENIHGYVAGDRPNIIHLTTSAFNEGVPHLIAVLLEEYIHLLTGFADESIQFQRYLLDMTADLIIKGK